jgi:3-oxoacyl-[acyl-carrier protein] reductase
MSFKGVAIITGGFGGIGWAITEALENQEYAVVVLSRSAESPENQAKLNSLPGIHKLALTCDVTVPAELERAKSIITAEYGRIDVLINCAGMSKPVAHNNLSGLTDELFDQVVTTNLRSVYSVIRTFQPFLSDDSVIVNISSAAGVRWGGSNMAYAASKAGVDSLTRNLARALAPRTRVVSVAPGAVDTGFAPSANYQQAIATTPLGRIATVKDVSDVVLSVVNNKFLTGNTIVVDGGRGI